MHNGALFDYGPAEKGLVEPSDATPHLRKVVEFYNRGGDAPSFGTLDRDIHPLNLSAVEIDDLVEFLKALTDNSFATTNPQGLASSPVDLEDVSDCPP